MALEQPGSAGVCARIKLKLDQQAVLSREAFRATLEIGNETSSPLEHISCDIQITDIASQPAADMFDIRPPDLSNLNDIDGRGEIAPGTNGGARWTIVPTVDAAPIEPTRYYISGVFRYTLNDTEFVVPLVPVPITVNPTARLRLHYFHQRDVFSDDPFTDIVEPSVPFNLAVMVQNWGAGAARNFRITSAQPEIVENEKGLLIDFKIIATEVAGQNMTLTLTAGFGDIMPGQIKIARWLLTSTLQGLFINYSASFEHLDGRGNPRLTLIDELRIHELIHIVQAGGSFEDGRPDFLVNDRPDAFDLPDTLWLSDGSSNRVEVLTNAVVTGTLSPGNLVVQLSAAMPPGWVYLRVPDPANGRYRLTDVLRSDGVHVAVDTNAWITDRTFLGLGKRPWRQDTLHLLDYDSTGQYTLRYEPLPGQDTEPPTSLVETLPAQSRPAFVVRWSGQDNPGGSGIGSYDVYYSEDGGAFVRWLHATPTTTAVFQGVMGKTYAFYSVATDAAGNRERTPVAPQAGTTVLLENRSPAFTPQTNVVILEGETLALVMSAADPDGDVVTYKLGPGGPAGLTLNALTGHLTWITSEPHGPSTNLITVIAQDSGMPSMSATQQFNVIVREVNTPPTIEPIADHRVYEGSLLSIACRASDADLPPQRLSFALGQNAPPGAAIDPASGIFTWSPREYQGGTNYQISILATDDGSTPLRTTQTFSVLVLDTLPDFRFAIGTTAVLSNRTGTLPLTLQSGVELKQVDLLICVMSDRLVMLHLTNLAPQIGSATLLPTGSNKFLLQFVAQSGAALQSHFDLAQLGFALVPDSHSAVAVLQGEKLDGFRPDGAVTHGHARSGRVYIVGKEPILSASLTSQRDLALKLYALPLRYYSIQRAPSLRELAWEFDSVVLATGLETDLPLRSFGGKTEFFRAHEANPALVLTLHSDIGQVVIEWPTDSAGFILEETDLISPATLWTRCQFQPEIQDGRYRVRIPLMATQRFYRLVTPRP